MLLRALVVLAAYGLSVMGFMFMLMGAMLLLANGPGTVHRLIPLVWLFAWVAHLRMSVAWVRDRPVPRHWPVWGTVAGIVSLASPLLAVLADTDVPPSRHFESALISAGVVAAFFLPGIALAVHLVRFHLAADEAKGSATP